MRAIHWYLETSGIVQILYGTSDFKLVDGEYIRFQYDGSDTLQLYCATYVVKDTPNNRMITEQIQRNHVNLVNMRRETYRQTYQLLNKIDK